MNARVIAPMLLLPLLACGPRSSDGVTTIRFWGMGREGEVVAELMDGFHRENPDIRVEVQQITVERRFDSFADYWDCAIPSNTLGAMLEATHADRLERLQANVRRRLQAGDGPLAVSARANAVAGIKP